MDNRKRVVITGCGAITSMGNNLNEIWSSVLDYQVGYRRISQDDNTITAKYFGFINFERKLLSSFSKKITKMLPPFAQYALIASQEAIQMAFGEDGVESSYSPFETGVFIGTGWGGLDSANQNNNDYQQHGLASSFATVMSMNNAATAAVSMNWSLRGPQNTPVAACATGSIAIGEAYHAIREGRAKMILAGGSESLKEVFNVWSIDIIQALSKEQEDIRLACCPFSSGRSGFVLSEGAAVLCLEDYESAKARGANILAEITGYANFSDAFDMTAPAEDRKARVQVIQSLCQQANTDADGIDYINLHGTSTPLNDVNESRAIQDSFGDAARRLKMSSTKSYTGHLIGAAGSLETIFCVKAMETGLLPATIHLDNPDPDCNLNYLPNQHLENQVVRQTMNLSFGFGGANAGLMLRRVD